MGKLLLGLVLVGSLASGGTNMTGMTITPQPPSVGDTITIKHPGPFPITVELDWDPPATPTQLTITSDAGATCVVPAGASSLIVVDPTGACKAISTTITP